MIKVLKFGGSSVQDAEAINRVIEHILRALANDSKLVVVISALAKVTNQLTELCWHSFYKHEIALEPLLALKQRHQTLAAKLIFSANTLMHAQQWIEQFFHQLEQTLTKIARLCEQQDKLVYLMATALAAGELLSSSIVHLALLARGIENKWLDARRIIVTDQQWLQAVPQRALIKDHSLTLLDPMLATHNLIVVPGFIGGTVSGATTLLGREGSDYSAALLAEAAGASELQIWSDVAGVMDIDPKLNTNAKVISQLSYEQAGELAKWGGKILYPASVDPARRIKIPIKLFNSFDAPNKASPGTIITNQDNQNLWAVTHLNSPLILFGETKYFNETLKRDLATHDFECRGILTQENGCYLIANDHGRPDGSLTPEDLTWLSRDYPNLTYSLDLDVVAIICSDEVLARQLFSKLPVQAVLTPNDTSFSHLALVARHKTASVLQSLYEKD